MKTIEFLSYINSLDVQVLAEGKRLRVNAPKGVLSPDLRAELAERKEELIALLHQVNLTTEATPLRILPISRDQNLQLSFAQQWLWFFDQLEPDNSTYNRTSAYRLIGPLNVTSLEQSFNEIIQRHEVFRTTFSVVDGQPVQVITPTLTLPLKIIDLRDLPETENKAHVQRLMIQERRWTFKLDKGPLFRTTLLQLGDQEYVLILTMHHIVSDGLSMGGLFWELSILYEAYSSGKLPVLPELPIQYADVAMWQRQWLKGDVLEKQLSYWKKQLEGAPSFLELPIDKPRPPVQTFRGDRQSLVLSKTLSEALKVLSRKEGGTLYMTLLASFQTLLHRYTGQEDVVVGSPIASRNRPEIEPLIGFFVNTLVMRTDFSGNPTFRELLSRVHETALGAYDHQDIPFEKLVEELQPERNLSHSPLFQVMFAFQNTLRQDLKLSELHVSQLKIRNETAKFDLTLSMAEEAEGLRGTFEYNTDLFDTATIKRMVEHFQTLLESIVADPGQQIGMLPILTKTERHKMLVSWNDTRQDYSRDRCIHQLFEEQVSRTPENVAVEFEDRKLTYKELNEKANQVAHFLKRQGVAPDVLVGVLMERSLEMVTGLLGILKAGGAYVPLDPSYPKERLSFMLEDAHMPVLVTQQGIFEHLSDYSGHILGLDTDWGLLGKESRENTENPIHIDDLAYVIYTSGSTGKPKGVMIPHRAICNHMHWMIETFSLTAEDRVLQKTPFSFDASVWEFFAPLLVGGRLVMARPGGHQDGQYLIRVISERQVTTLQLVPSLLRLLLEEEGLKKCSSLKRVFCGGEVLTVELQKRFLGRLNTNLYNLYGPTEAAIDTTYWVCRRGNDRQTVPIGRPIANAQTYVLDPHLQPVPIGVSGELYIGGEGLARGYLNRPDLTAERFLTDPFSDEPDARIYKTGDLGRWLPDGAIEFLGRNDFQVKIRGFRIELGEIEAQLAAVTGIAEAVVLVREDNPGSQRLVAYYTVKDAAAKELNAEALRHYLANLLPDYMLPSAYVTMECFPLTPNGKTDHKALPPPEAAAYATRVYEAPMNELEETLARIWSELLGVEKVGRHDHFFELGGHSLLVVTLIERLRRKGLYTDVRALFTTPTLMDLAAVLCKVKAPVQVLPNRILPDCDRITPELLPLIALEQNDIDRIVTSTPGGAANIQDIYPLAPLQEGILFHHLMKSQSDVYLLLSILAFDNRELLDGFLTAFQAVINRHDILRTAVLWEELPEPVQVVWRKALLAVEQVTIDPSAGDAVGQLRSRFNRGNFGIDIRKAPMIRAFIARDDADGRWLLALPHHHLVTDHTTLEILGEEIRAHLDGEASGLPAALPFRDFVAQARLGVGREEHEAFFRRILEDVDEPTAPFGLQDVRGDGSDVAEARLPLDMSLSRRLRERARMMGVSTASLFHLAWARVLACLSGRNDVVFGTVLFGRMQGGLGADRVMGTFINTLPVRIDIKDETVEQAVKETHRMLAELLYHEHAPLALAQRCSGVPAPMPLFSSLLNYRYSRLTLPGEDTNAVWGGIERLHAEERTNYPVVLSVNDLGEGFSLNAQVHTSIESMRVCEFMNTVIGHLVKALEQAQHTAIRYIEVLPQAERQQVLFDWNATQTDYPKNLCVHQIFEMQAKKTPEAVALEFDGDRLSYRELDSRANQIANYLRIRGVGPDILVGICMERSREMVVGMLAILKAGGAYVPLDPSYPEERLDFMLAESNPPVLLTQKRFVGKFRSKEVFCLDDDWGTIRHFGEECPNVNVGPDDLAYVMYTSGSTGRPKGVCVPHIAISRLVLNTNYVTLTSSDRLAHASNTSFDAATFEIWGALLNGACPVGMTTYELLSPRFFAEHLRKKRITVLFLTTALFNQIAAEAPSAFSSLENLMFGGEAVDPKWVKTVLKKGEPKRLLHVYGPTENTTFSTWYHVKDVSENAVTIPIGQPISNSQCYILDKHLNPVPVGVAGELYLGGDGLARGYLNRPELTAEKFIPNPFSKIPDASLYKTGDIVRYLLDENIEFIGRSDNQIKLKGFRIELGEIESVLKSRPGVHDAVALIREDQPGDKRIVTYVVLNPGEKTDNEEFRNYVQKKLPEYMVPSAFAVLDSFPLTQNGKVDRKALPAPDLSPAMSRQSFLAPRDSLELYLAKIWEKLLGTVPVGIRDNFFDLGGHSLLAIQVISQIKKYTGQEIAVADLFKHPTIEQLSQIIQSKGWSSPYSLLIPFQPLGSKLPFFCIHGAAAEAANLIGLEQPFYGGIPHGFFGGRIPATVEEMAAEYIKEIKMLQSEGPYFIGGYSFGGLVAFEMAHQLKSQGKEVALLALIDPTSPGEPKKKQDKDLQYGQKQNRLLSMKSYTARVGKHFMVISPMEKISYIIKGIWGRVGKKTGIERKIIEYIYRFCLSAGISVPESFRRPYRGLMFKKAALKYPPKKYDGRAILFKIGNERNNLEAFWQRQIEGDLEVHELPPDHHLDVFNMPHVEVLARKLKTCLEKAQNQAQDN